MKSLSWLEKKDMCQFCRLCMWFEEIDQKIFKHLGVFKCWTKKLDLFDPSPPPKVSGLFVIKVGGSRFAEHTL